MFPIPGLPHKPDPELMIREIEDDPLTRLTWRFFAGTTRLAGILGRWSGGDAAAEPPMTLTEQELDFLKSRRLAHMATVDHEGRPDAAPVSFSFDGKAFYVGDLQMRKTALNRVSLVIDELLSPNPNDGRGIRIYGRAEVLEEEGPIARCLRIIPQVTSSWGINATPG